ncbi:MAG: Rad52/Rad22 family DNA repair protein [Pseudomonadota bacterium]
MDWEKVSNDLQQPLDPAAIKQPPKGKFGEYVEGYHVIREANRIFGENGWSYTVTRLEQTHMAEVELNGSNGAYKQLRCSFLCSVRVDVDGVIREGLAVGVGNGKPENAGDVIESAVKEAETDALKRAMRTFGNTFGLALYEKDKAKREVGVPFDAEAQYTRLSQAIKAQNDRDTLDKLWGQNNVKAVFAQFSDDDKAAILQEYTTRMGELIHDGEKAA